MDAPTLYAFRPATGELIGPVAADPSPLEPGTWLCPAHTTEAPPPEIGAGQAARWTGEAWEIVADRRGETWHAADGMAVVVDALGDPADQGLSVAPPEPSFADRRASKRAAIAREMADCLALGAPVPGGLHVALDDAARADMAAMATTALAAAAGSVPWPASYVAGWIAMENTRIPLTTPADGLALAAAVGDHYARIRQHGRDLKDAALAATDDATLAGIDETSGWPE